MQHVPGIRRLGTLEAKTVLTQSEIQSSKTARKSNAPERDQAHIIALRALANEFAYVIDNRGAES